MSVEVSRHSEAWFRALIEHSTDAIALLAPDSRIIYASPSTERIIGYTAEELVGMHSYALVHPDDLMVLVKQTACLGDQPGDFITFEYRQRHKNGSWRWMEGTATNLLMDPAVGAVVCNYRDITERKLAEERLQQSEERYRVLVEQAPVGIFLADQEGHYLEVNPSGCALFGCSREELLTTCIEEWIFENDRAALQKALELLRAEQTTLTQWQLKRRDGTTTHIEVNAKILSTGLIQGIIRDISDRKEAERRKQEFLSMVSHELRTPLTAIQGLVELALLYVERHSGSLSPEEDDLIHKIEVVLQRAERQVDIETRLVEALLDVSRMEMNKFELELTRCNLSVIVQEVVANQQQGARTRHIELILQQQELVPVIADAGRIGQVLTNYLTNALKYSPPDQTVLVRLEVEGNKARVSVRDHGSGLNPEQQQKIWERFYQTEGSAHRGGEGGLGLGLAIAQTIVQQHHGQVGVESSPGHGSTFWFTLPLVDDGLPT